VSTFRFLLILFISSDFFRFLLISDHSTCLLGCSSPADRLPTSTHRYIQVFLFARMGLAMAALFTLLILLISNDFF
jgi:hypothetical protein